MSNFQDANGNYRDGGRMVNFLCSIGVTLFCVGLWWIHPALMMLFAGFLFVRIGVNMYLAKEVER